MEHRVCCFIIIVLCICVSTVNHSFNIFKTKINVLIFRGHLITLGQIPGGKWWHKNILQYKLIDSTFRLVTYVFRRSAPLAFNSVTQRIVLSSPITLSTWEDNPTTIITELEASNWDYITFRTMSNRQKLTVINFCVTNLCCGCFYALLGPFFPTEVNSFIT